MSDRPHDLDEQASRGEREEPAGWDDGYAGDLYESSNGPSTMDRPPLLPPAQTGLGTPTVKIENHTP